MPRISTIPFQYRPEDNGRIGFARGDLFLLTEPESEALGRAEDVIIEEIEAAGLDTERVRGTVELSGTEPRITFCRLGMDPVGPTDPRLKEPRNTA